MGHRHPQSLKNLTPRKSGQFQRKGGNPRKRRVTIRMGEMLDAGVTVADLEVLVRNPNNLAVEMIAAQVLLTACTDPKRFVIGKDGKLRPAARDPECGRAADRVMDRLEGRAPQRIEVTRRTEGPSLPDVIREAQAIAKQLGPVKVNAMVEALQAKLAANEGHAIVDTTATALPVAQAMARTVSAAGDGDRGDEGFSQPARAAAESVREPEPEQQGPGGWMRSYDETGERMPIADPV